MKLLVLCQSFAPLFEGGTERVARAHAEAVAQTGVQVRVLACAPMGAGGSFDVDGLPVHFIEERAEAVSPLDERLLLERPLRRSAVLEFAGEYKPDVVHIQHQASLSLGLVDELGKLGARVVVGLHDLFATCPRFFRAAPPETGIAACPAGPEEGFGTCATCIAGEAPQLANEVITEALGERDIRFRRELGAAHALVAPSASHARRLEGLLGLDLGRIEVVPNGLVAALEAPKQALAAPGPGEPLRLLHFGNLARSKGLVELVQAASGAASQAVRPIHLSLAGTLMEADLQAELEGLAGPLVLEFCGAYQMAELALLAARAHCAVFASKALESYGLVVDEALALGLPVLVADSGALAERVGAAGLVLPRIDGQAALEAWTSGIANLAADPAQLMTWRGAIPDNMRGPKQAAELLLELYRSPQS